MNIEFGQICGYKWLFSDRILQNVESSTGSFLHKTEKLPSDITLEKVYKTKKIHIQ